MVIFYITAIGCSTASCRKYSGISSMATGLDVATGIAGLITLADVVIDRTWRTIKACKNAGQKRQALLREAQSLHGVLSGLQKLAGQVSQGSLATHVPTVEIYSCQQLLTRLRDKLLKADPNEDGISTGKKWLRTLKWPITNDETQSILKELDRFKSTFDLTVSLDVLETIFASSSDQRKIAHGVDDVRKALENITRIQITAERKGILNFFGTHDAEVAHRNNTQLRQQGTGLWLTKGTELQNWLIARNAKLWMYGISGAGKTVLASAAIDETLQHVTSSQGIAHYYCDYTSNKSLILPNIIACLCGQLAQQSEECFELLFSVYQPDRNLPPLNSMPSVGDLTRLFSSMASHFDDVFIIVDGVDECNDKGGVTMALVELARISSEVRLLLSSRDEQAIRLHMSDFDPVSIAAKNEDLKLYVSAEIALRTAKGTLNIKNTTLKDEILDRLVHGADGMFRWVACQIDYLSRLRTDAARRKALRALPPDLTTTYDRVLERVNSDGEETARIVQKALRWLYDSFRLSPDELCEALAVEDGMFDPDAKPDIDAVLICCGSLVRTDLQSRLELAHFTVKEYLSSARVQQHANLKRYYCDETAVQTFKAETCLQYLSLNRFSGVSFSSAESVRSFLAETPFYNHAASYWFGYYLLADQSAERLQASLEGLFAGTLKCFDTWRLIDSWLQDTNTDEVFEDEELWSLLKDILSLSPLHYAALYRLHKLIPILVANGGEVNKDSILGPPLFCAFHLSSRKAQRLRNHHMRQWKPATLIKPLESTITNLAAHGANMGCLVRCLDDDLKCNLALGEYCTPLCQSLSAGGTRQLLECGAPLDDHQYC